MLAHKTIFVIDAYGLLYQLFHALPPMSSPMGEPVGAVYGFTKDLFTLIERYKPDYLFCAFDLPGKTFRSELFAEYKANRSVMPEDLQSQITFVHEILEAFGIAPLARSGFEADDIMATIARLTAAQNGNCVIVTNDKDCRQLINDNVSLLNLRKQSFYKTEELFADWGIRPNQVVDFQSFVGDPTDNVPGVAKIGQKTAAELLQHYDTLEGVYENIEKITGKKKEILLAGKENALFSRRLVALKNDVPIDVTWSEYHGFNVAKLRELFQRFGFKSLMGKFEREPTTVLLDIASKQATPRQATQSLVLSPTYHLIDTSERFTQFFAQFEQQTLFAFDTETAPMENRFEATSPRYTVIVGMSFAWNDNEAWYLPFRGPLGSPVLPRQETFSHLRAILENPAIKKVGQNLKYDTVVLKNAGINFQGIAFDTMLADYLLRPERTHNLDDMAEHYLHHKTIKIAELIGTGKKQKQMDTILTETLAQYAGEDALVVWHLHRVLKEQIEWAS